MPNWLKATIVERLQWSNRLCSLKLDVDIPEFTAGQCINLGLEIDGKPTLRPYSLVNAPGKALKEIYFNRIEDGVLSTRLFSAQPGDVLLSAPRASGVFTLAQVPSAQQLWMCATGTAISPYLSMLHTLDPWESFERVILIHGVRDHGEMSYLGQLRTIKNLHPHQFDYFYSITRETNTTQFTQRIPELLLSREIENVLGLTLTPNNAQVMLCGNSGMINTCLAILGERGLVKSQRRTPGQVTVEAYQ